MTKLTDRDIQLNEQALAHAIAQQRLEGLEVPSETINLLQQVAHGEIGIESAIQEIIHRSGYVPVLD